MLYTNINFKREKKITWKGITIYLTIDDNLYKKNQSVVLHQSCIICREILYPMDNNVSSWWGIGTGQAAEYLCQPYWDVSILYVLYLGIHLLEDKPFLYIIGM